MDISSIALLRAIEAEEPTMVKFLLDNGADPNFIEEGNYMPLHAAVESRVSQSVELLLAHQAEDRRANPNLAPDDEDSLVHMAARRDLMEIVKLLLENGAHDWKGSQLPLLAYSIEWSSPNVVDYLLTLVKDGLVDINQRNELGETALHVAVKMKLIEDTVKLLDHGADPNIENCNRKTPLLFAASQNSNDICKLLLDSTADLQHQDGCQRDVLYWASLVSESPGMPATVKDLSDKMGREAYWKRMCSSATHAAVQANNRPLIEFLLSEMGDVASGTDRNGWTVQYSADRYQLDWPETIEPLDYEARGELGKVGQYQLDAQPRFST